MRLELPYTDDIARAELVLGSDLHYPDAVEGGLVRFTEAQRFTALSVVTALERAVLRDRAAAEGQGQAFDRDGWMPDDETTASIYGEHRPHRHYLSGVNGVRTFYQGLVDGTLTFDEPHYEHQIETFGVALTYLEDSDPFATASPGAYAELSGGAGKSRIIAELTAAFKSQEDSGDPNRVFIIAPDLEVQAELIGADGTSGFGKYAPHIKPGLINQKNKDFAAAVGIGTVHMVRKMLGENPAALEAYDLVLADEAHRLLGQKTTGVIHGVSRPIVGVTGSARYSGKKQVSDLLPVELIKRGTRELIIKGNLAPAQFWICKTDQIIYQEAGRADYTDAELKRISKMPERHQIAADAGLAFFRDGRNGIFSCNTVAEAKEFAKRMNGMKVKMPDGRERKILVVPVFGKSGEDNHAIFQALDADEIQAVTIVDIDTGWDAPLASFLVNVRPTASPVVGAQRSARLNRRTYDIDGNIVTSQYFDLVDIVRRKRKRGEELMWMAPPRQITVPQLLGETVYNAGLVIASPATEGKRRDFTAAQFPRHLRWAVSMADGVDLRRLPSFGAGVKAEEAPEGFLTRIEVARALGTTVSRLNVVVEAAGVILEDGFFNEAAVDKAAEHLMRLDDPLL